LPQYFLANPGNPAKQIMEPEEKRKKQRNIESTTHATDKEHTPAGTTLHPLGCTMPIALRPLPFPPEHRNLSQEYFLEKIWKISKIHPSQNTHLFSKQKQC
jgi:hypothetical protein